MIKYVVDSFWDQFSKYENLETVHGLKIKYDQVFRIYCNLSLFQSFEFYIALFASFLLSVINEFPCQSLECYDIKDNNGAIATEPRKQSGERGLEKEEEDYFNEDRFVYVNLTFMSLTSMSLTLLFCW